MLAFRGSGTVSLVVMPVKFDDRFGETPTRRTSKDFSTAGVKQERRGSDPALKALDLAGEPLLSTSRNASKTKTYSHSIDHGRHDDVHIPPKDLAELHRLHEERRKKATNTKPEDTSPAALEAIWTDSTWTAFGELPLGTKERPMHVRKTKLFPPGEKTEGSFSEWKGSAINTKGQKGLGDNNIGQDNYSVSQLDDGWQVICVMDGHGPGGHWPATRAVQTTPFFLQAPSCKKMLRQGQAKAAITHAFKKVQEDLEYRSALDNVDIQVSGCTAVALLVHPRKDKIWVGTSGDSRCIMFVPGQEEALETTRDHKPSDEEEKARVESSGCEVTRTEYEDGWVEERVNIAGRDYPGISMTRSLGDLLVKNHGIIAEPEVVEWSKVPGAMLFLATDGVWEFLENEDVVRILSKSLAEGSTPDQACKILLKASRDAWKDHEGTYCDDITMVLLSCEENCGRFGRSGTTTCCAGCTLL